MNGKLYLPLPRRSQTGWMMDVLMVLPFLLPGLTGLLGLPSALRYGMDGAWVGLTVYLLRFRQSLNWYALRGLPVWILAFLCCTLLVYGVQYQSGLYYLWGLRNTFRFYGAFFAFALFGDREETKRYDAMLDALFWINAGVSAVQYLAFGLRGDHLGGLFGTESGANGYTNIFFLVVLTGSVVRCLQQQEGVLLCVAKCLTAVVIAALAELKFFFLELPLLLCLAGPARQLSWRKIGILLGGMAAVLLGAGMLAFFFPQYRGWFSPEWIFRAVTARRGYTSTGDLNRLTAIGGINSLWLRHWSQRLFGKGLGNCDTSAFAFLNTPFFRSHGHMHYSWISYAFQYLETGWVGLMFYWGFFVLLGYRLHRMEKHCPDADTIRCRVGKILACFCLLLSVYNASLRAESAYMLYYALAAPFAAGRESRKEVHHDRFILGRV